MAALLRSRIPKLYAYLGVLFGLIGMLALASVFAVIGLVVFEGDPMSALERAMRQDLGFPAIALSMVGQTLALVGVPIAVALLARTSVKEGLGLRAAPWKIHAVGAMGILALGPTSDVLARLAAEVLPDASLGSLEMIEKLVREHSFLILWPMMALAPGVGEELFCRGLLQRASGFGWRAITLSAIFFSLLHLDPHHAAGVLPLGFYLAWLADRSGSTWVTITAHTVNNSAALLAGKFAMPDQANVSEAMPWSVVVGGWLIGAVCIYAIHMWTRDRGRMLGPAAEPDATELRER